MDSLPAADSHVGWGAVNCTCSHLHKCLCHFIFSFPVSLLLYAHLCSTFLPPTISSNLSLVMTPSLSFPFSFFFSTSLTFFLPSISHSLCLYFYFHPSFLLLVFSVPAAVYQPFLPLSLLPFSSLPLTPPSRPQHFIHLLSTFTFLSLLPLFCLSYLTFIPSLLSVPLLSLSTLLSSPSLSPSVLIARWQQQCF